MSKLEQIERSILELSPTEMKAFTEWFDAIQEQNFDAAIKRDSDAGALDALADKALSDFKAGRTRPL